MWTSTRGPGPCGQWGGGQKPDFLRTLLMDDPLLDSMQSCAKTVKHTTHNGAANKHVGPK